MGFFSPAHVAVCSTSLSFRSQICNRNHQKMDQLLDIPCHSLVSFSPADLIQFKSLPSHGSVPMFPAANLTAAWFESTCPWVLGVGGTFLYNIQIYATIYIHYAPQVVYKFSLLNLNIHKRQLPGSICWLVFAAWVVQGNGRGPGRFYRKGTPNNCH